MKKQLALVLAFALLLSVFPVNTLAAKRKKEETIPVFKHHEFEHRYQLQDDSYEATDTEGGYRHYICADCGDEYSYTMDPLVYKVNPKTGGPVDQAGAYNPLLPSWEHIPDPEPQVFWSKADNEWRCYIYGSHDNTGIGYCGFNYLLYSAPVYDLSDWRYEGVYLTLEDENGERHATSGATVGLFAPDCAYDVNTDTYWMISNEFNAYDVLRVADNPCGPWPENEGEWFISVKAAYDPSILIDRDGTFYIAGSCMKPVYNTYPEIEAAVAADDYKSGMSHIGVLYQLKKDLSDGNGIEAISWLPGENRTYMPIYEGPSIGWVDELGRYVYFYVSYDVQSDGTWYNSGLGWMWTDDLMKGIWHFGENGVEETYPELDYVISGNHGNIVSDTSGRYQRDPATGEMKYTEFPTYTYGNNHGSLVKINGKWYFFGQRQTQRTPYSRQLVAGEVQVYMDGDTPVIVPFEYTSSGIAGSIPAYEGAIAADRTTYLIPAADHYAPATEKTNVHSDCLAKDPYITATRDENAVHATYIAELRSGNIAGFKYLDFGDETVPTAWLLLSLEETAPDGTVDVFVDAPTEDQGGTRIGTIPFSARMEAIETGTDGRGWARFSAAMDAPVSGRHGVFFVFNAPSDDMIGAFDQFGFEK